MEFFLSVQGNPSKKSIVSKNLLKALYNNCYLSSDFESEIVKNGFQPISSKISSAIRGYEKVKPEAEEKIEYEDQIVLGCERFVAPEIFFKPYLFEKMITCKSLDNLVLDAIRCTPPALHQFFLQNIFLVGGNTKFDGLKDRLRSSIQQKVPRFPVTVHQNQFSVKFDAWKGARFFSLSKNFLDLCIDSTEYNEIELRYKFF